MYHKWSIWFVWIMAIFTVQGQLKIQAENFLTTSTLDVVQQSEQALCWDAATIEGEMTEETFEDFISSVGQGEGLYFDVRPTSSDITPIGNGTYHVLTDTSVEVSVSIFTPSPSEQNLRYMVLLNEKPMPQIITESGELYYQDITVNPNEIYTINFQIPALENGINDFIFLAIPDFNAPPSPLGGRVNYAPRMTLISGEPTNPDLVYENLREVGLISNNDPLISLELTLGDDLRVWNYPEAYLTLKQGEDLKFNVVVGTNTAVNLDAPSEARSRFAIVTFLDYQTISVEDISPTLYGEVTYDTAYTRIPIELTPDLPIGQYDLLVLKINNPRVPMCVMRDRAGSFNPFVNSVRVSIRIEE